MFQVFWLDKNVPEYSCIKLGVVICKNHVAKPLDSEAGDLFGQLGKLFLQNFENLLNFIFGQPRVRASRASSAQKSQGLRMGLFQNFSRASFVVSWGSRSI